MHWPNMSLSSSVTDWLETNWNKPDVWPKAETFTTITTVKQKNGEILEQHSDLRWPTVTYGDLQWPTVTCSDLQWPTVTCSDYSDLQWPTVTYSDLQWLQWLQWPTVTTVTYSDLPLLLPHVCHRCFLFSSVDVSFPVYVEFLRTFLHRTQNLSSLYTFIYISLQ